MIGPFRTARLLVRPVLPEDAEAVHRARSQMPFDPPKRDLAATRAMIAELQGTATDAPGWRQLVVVANGAVVGDFGIHFGHPRPGQAEIGFAFDPAARGHGYAFEAGEALVERLFALGLHRLYALTDSRNVPAQRLLTRLRFRQEAHHVRSWPQGDDWFDEFAYARLADEGRDA